MLWRFWLVWVKAGVKVDGFKTADSKTVYYAVVLVEAVAQV